MQMRVIFDDIQMLTILFIVLLSVRSQKQWPEDPHKHLIDFFGNYKDPMWDKMDEWREENEDIRTNQLPSLRLQIQETEQALAKEKRRTYAYRIYKGADPDVTVSTQPNLSFD